MPASSETISNDARITPAMKQYFRFKERHPDCVLFFRMGDFYEMFYEDAVEAHRILGLTLTERTPGVPMAGVPYHAVDGYLRRMIQAGRRVAVCEQIEDPKEAKGVVERAVTRVLTPGTLSDESLLEDDDTRTLAAISFLDAGDDADGRVAVAVADASTGALSVFITTASIAPDELARRGVRELLFAQTATGETPPRAAAILEKLGVSSTPRPSWQFRQSEALEAILAQHRVATVAGFGFTDDDPALQPVGAVVYYLRETQTPSGEGAASSHWRLAPPRRDDLSETLRLDATSLRALEVERTMRTGSSDGSLFGVFQGKNACRTPMGRRLLRDWLLRPPARRAAIESRQSCVAALVDAAGAASALDAALTAMQDAARIAGRLGVGRVTARDLVALGGALRRHEALLDALEGSPAFGAARRELIDLRESLAPVAEEIERVCVTNPPAHLREGGLIRDDVDEELDEARRLQRDAAGWLAEYQTRVAAEFNLPGVRIGFNRVFGYYIELTRAQARAAPDVFIRKQTLKNAERYITPELKEFEEKITTAESRAVLREQQMFQSLCELASARTPAIRAFAQIVAELDCLATFARVATRRGWSRPTIVEEPILDIRDGAHPVLAAALGDRFVNNDAILGTNDPPARLALLTGPNMAGKSTFIRQVALIVLLAHTGSFVPASSAVIGLTDRIFTRVGADDALHAGQSTFMVEMVETANILHHATSRSLVILDEIGRGTSTLDGLALAWAIAERLAGIGAENTAPSTPRTLFATHYHELTTLEDEAPDRVRNLHVVVREWGDEIIFLHRIESGRTDQSYGIHVAKLAGLPHAVVDRARVLLDTLSVTHEGAAAHSEANPANRPPAGSPAATAQLSLFTEYLDHPALAALREIDPDDLSPSAAIEALRTLWELARRSSPA